MTTWRARQVGSCQAAGRGDLRRGGRTDRHRSGDRGGRADRPEPDRSLVAVLDQRKLLAGRIEELLVAQARPLSKVLTSMPGLPTRAISLNRHHEGRAHEPSDLKTLGTHPRAGRRHPAKVRQARLIGIVDPKGKVIPKYQHRQFLQRAVTHPCIRPMSNGIQQVIDVLPLFDGPHPRPFT